MRIILLLLLALSLNADDLSEARAKVKDPVLVVFTLTVVNKDKNTSETTTISQIFTLKVWEQTYRPFTLLEFKTYDTLGYIKAQPVKIMVQTL